MADANPVQVVQRTGLATVSDVDSARRQADSLVSGAITSLKREFKIPGTAGVDLTEFSEALDSVRDSQENASDVISTETGRMGKATEAQKGAIGREGNAVAQQAIEKQIREQQVAGIYENYARMFGIGDNADSNIAHISAELARVRPEAQAKLERVRAMDSVGFLDNPAQWFINQIQRPAAASDYNRTADTVDLLQESIDKSIKTAQDAAQFSTKAIPTITRGEAKAQADAAIALADKNKALADENLARVNVTFAVQELAGQVSVANLTAKMTEEERQKEHMRYTSLINEINLADNHATRMLKAANLIETLEKTKGLDVILENYDKVMGHPKGTTTRYTFEKFGEPQRQNMVAIGAGSLGPDPFYGMVNYYSSRPGPGVSRQTSQMMNWLREKSEGIQQSADIQRLDEKQKGPAISARLRTEVDAEMQNPAGKMNNIFYEVPPTDMINAKMVPPGTKLALLLEGLTKQTGPVPTSTVVELINKNYSSPNEAGAVLSDYYKKNIELRNVSMNTSLVNIKPPSTYVMRDSLGAVGDFFGLTRQKFDLTNPADATKYVLFLRMREQMDKGRSFALGVP